MPHWKGCDLLSPGTYATLEGLWFCCHQAHMPHWKDCGIVVTRYICHTGRVGLSQQKLDSSVVVAVIPDVGSLSTVR